MNVYKGLLFPTNALRPIIVDIPLLEGVPILRSLSDLNVNYWVNQRDCGPYNACREPYRIVLRNLPNSITPLDHDYTMFFESPRTFPKRNNLARMINKRRNGQDGNILFVKLVQGDPRHVLNMDNDDISLTTYLLKRSVVNCTFSVVFTMLCSILQSAVPLQ